MSPQVPPELLPVAAGTHAHELSMVTAPVGQCETVVKDICSTNALQLLSVVSETLRNYPDTNTTDLKSLEQHMKIRVLNGAPPNKTKTTTRTACFFLLGGAPFRTRIFMCCSRLSGL